VPAAGPLDTCPANLKADYLERRELGILNIGGSRYRDGGTVAYELARRGLLVPRRAKCYVCQR
jgi:5-keto 4-deoxyuronate isomerase